MNAGPWVLRAAAVLFIIAVDSAEPSLAVALIGLAAFCALSIFLFEFRSLPRFIMDVLDRLTDKHALQQGYDKRKWDQAVIDAEELRGRLKERVIGQDGVLDRIAVQIRRRLAARRTDRPVAVICFAGPPGVGKTHLAKVMAEELFGDRKHLHFFDMTQFGQPHAAASLFGQARGYVGSQSYGALTAALRDTPDAVVLLDEFEKAHPEVHKRFLTAWNDGFLTELSDGARVPTDQAIFVLTTNAASRRIGELATEHQADAEKLARSVKTALEDAQFAPEVLSRIDEVFPFRALEGLDIARVVALEMEALTRQFGLEIEAGGIDPRILLGAIETMANRMDGGVRDVARAIERQVSDGLIEARSAGALSVRLCAVDDRVEVEAVTMRKDHRTSDRIASGKLKAARA